MMPETPDFNEIARVAVMTFYDTTPRPTRDERAAVANIAERLRLIWNARGDADIAKLETELATHMGVAARGPYVMHLDRALHSLDR